MKKIISLFQRNYDGDRLVRDEVTPGAEWVIAGEGIATRKWDGTCCMVRDGKLYKRYDAKPGRVPPEGFEPAQEFDPVTGHQPGWIACVKDPSDKYHWEAYNLSCEEVGGEPLPNGTYELCGPKINGNPEGFGLHHVLIPHGHDVLVAPRSFADLREYLRSANIEGVVWHHPDGRMVKIKTKDFGLVRRADYGTQR